MDKITLVQAKHGQVRNNKSPPNPQYDINFTLTNRFSIFLFSSFPISLLLSSFHFFSQPFSLTIFLSLFHFFLFLSLFLPFSLYPFPFILSSFSLFVNSFKYFLCILLSFNVSIYKFYLQILKYVTNLNNLTKYVHA